MSFKRPPNPTDKSSGHSCRVQAARSSALWFPVRAQQLVNTAVEVLGQSAQHIREVSLRLQAIELGQLAIRLMIAAVRCAPSCSRRTTISCAPGPSQPLNRVVVDRQVPVLNGNFLMFGMFC